MLKNFLLAKLAVEAISTCVSTLEYSDPAHLLRSNYSAATLEEAGVSTTTNFCWCRVIGSNSKFCCGQGSNGNFYGSQGSSTQMVAEVIEPGHGCYTAHMEVTAPCNAQQQSGFDKYSYGAG